MNPVGRLGVRYGKRVRDRISAAEAGLRRKHTCQNCGFKAVTRVSVGIWTCRKCGNTFAGGAYIPKTAQGLDVDKMLKGSIKNISE